MLECITRMRKGEHVVIVFIGDSITEINESTHDKFNYTGLLGLRLEERFGRVFTIINSGVSGNCTDHILERLERDVLRYTPDLVMLMVGMNDPCKGLSNLGQFTSNLEKIIANIQDKGSEILMLTENPLSFEIEENRLSRSAYPRYVDAIRHVAAESDILLCDIYKKWENLISTDDMCNNLYNYWRLMNDHIHPNEYGHAFIANTIFEFLSI